MQYECGLFPLPLRVGKNVGANGSIVSVAESCRECIDRECERDARRDELKVCSYGAAYILVRLSDDAHAVVHGVYISDWDPPLDAKKSLRRLYRSLRSKSSSSLTDLKTLRKSVSALASIKSEQIGRLSAQVRSDIHSAASDEAMRIVQEEMRRSLSGLSSSLIHDQLQLLARVFQNVEVCANMRYGSAEDFVSVCPLDTNDERIVFDRLKSALAACELLRNRLEALRLTFESPRRKEWQRRNPHHVITKLRYLYRVECHAKQITFKIGPCSTFVPMPREESLHFIPFQNIVDNAIKYAPRRSVVGVDFDETRDDILKVTFESIGPLISPNESEMIFTVGVRGAAAEGLGIPGSGLGLAQSKEALLGWGQVSVTQAADESARGLFLTRFVVDLAKNPIV